MPELQKVLHSMKVVIDNSADPPQRPVVNTGLTDKLLP